MLTMLVRNQVRDYARWRRVLDEQTGPATDAGLHLTAMWRDIENPDNVFFTFRVDDLDRARAYVTAPESAEVGKRAGVIDGELHILEEV